MACVVLLLRYVKIIVKMVPVMPAKIKLCSFKATAFLKILPFKPIVVNKANIQTSFVNLDNIYQMENVLQLAKNVNNLCLMDHVPNANQDFLSITVFVFKSQVIIVKLW